MRLATRCSPVLIRAIVLAIELAPHKITVNAYAPGVILTPMSEYRTGLRCMLDPAANVWLASIDVLDKQYGGTHGAFTKHVSYTYSRYCWHPVNV